MAGLAQSSRYSTPHWFVPVVALAGLLFGFGGYRLFSRGESPRDAWAEVSAAAERGDYGAVWDCIHPDTRARCCHRSASTQRSRSRAAALSDHDAYTIYLANHPDVLTQFLPAPDLDVQEKGELADVELDRADPYPKASFAPTMKVGLKRHAGRWLLVQTADVSKR